MRVSTGDKLGPCEITGLLGTGGMGAVYRANVSRLGREVAIKVSAESFTDRFEREARAVAALNHPNICTLHNVGPNYLVMEVVEGPTLADRIKEGPIPLDEALAIAMQIAERSRPRTTPRVQALSQERILSQEEKVTVGERRSRQWLVVPSGFDDSSGVGGTKRRQLNSAHGKCRRTLGGGHEDDVFRRASRRRRCRQSALARGSPGSEARVAVPPR